MSPATTPPSPPATPPAATSHPAPPRRRRWRRWFVWTLVILALLLVLTRLLLPTITERGIEYFAAEELGVPVTVRNVDFGLLRGSIVIEGLAVGSDDARWDRIDVELNWKALLDEHIQVEALNLRGPLAHLMQGSDGRLALTTQQLARLQRAEAVLEAAGEKIEEAESSGAAWSFELRRLSITDQELTLTDAEGRVALDVLMGELRLDGLRYDAEGLSLAGVTLDGLRVTARDDVTFGPPAPDEEPPGEPLAVRVASLLLTDADLTLQRAAGDLHLTPRLEIHDVALEAGESLVLSVAQLLLSETAVEVRDGDDQLRLTPRLELRDVALQTGEPLALSVAHLLLSETAIDLQGGDQQLHITPRLELRDVTLEPGAQFPVTLNVGIDPAALAVTGELGLEPPSFRGQMTLTDLGLHPYVGARLATALPEYAGWWRDGNLGLDLTVAYAPEAADVSGRIGLDRLALSDPADERRALAWESFEVVARAVHVPLQGDAAPQLELASLTLATPRVSWVLPPAAPTEAEGAAPADGDPTDAPAGTTDNPADHPSDHPSNHPSNEVPPPPPALELTLDTLTLTDGELLFTDESLRDGGLAEPIGMTEFNLSGTQLRYPELRVLGLRLTGLTAARAPLVITGDIDGDTGDMAVLIDSLPLPRFSALAESAAGYVLHDGELSLDTSVAMRGTRYETDSTIKLHDLDISTDDPGAFSDAFGMPLDLALALLRDPSGDITLDVPVAIDGGAVETGLGSIIGTALREALVGAITSPFKLLGSVFDMVAGGSEGEADLQAFPCVPGQVQLVADGVDSLEPLIELIEDRPALALRLRGAAGPEDRDALALDLLMERAVAGTELPELEDAGWFGPGNIQEALVERANGQPGALDDEDEALLMRYVAAVEPSPEAYTDLARRRAEALRDLLIVQHGLADDAIVVGKQADDPAPAVHADFTVRGG